MHFESPFTPKDLERAEAIACHAVARVAPTLRENFGKCDYDAKDGDERSWVTKWDRWGQAVLLEELAQFDDAVGVNAEEDGVRSDAPTHWTVDSIDGTAQFVRGAAMCTTMVSLVHEGTPLVSVINDFVHDDIFTARANAGAYKNHTKRLQVSRRPLNIGFLELYTDHDTPNGQRLWQNIEATGAYIVRYAATGFAMVSVARGSNEALVSVGNPTAYEWDVAPEHCLSTRPAVSSRNRGQETFDLRNPDFIASNQVAHDSLKGIVEQSLAA